jgi:hypothetical protein
MFFLAKRTKKTFYFRKKNSKKDLNEWILEKRTEKVLFIKKL